MQLATFVASMVAWLAGSTAAALQTRITPAAIEIESRSFCLPVILDESQRKSAASISLFVSTDRGRTWKLEQKGPAEQGLILFKAPRDAEYWFSVQVTDKFGKKSPEDVSKESPGLRVLVRSKKVPATSSDPSPPIPFAEKEKDPLEDLEKFVTTYHTAPAPERARRFLDLALTERIQQHPVLKGKPHARTLLAHGFGHMGRREPKLIRDMENRFPGASAAGKEFLLECLRICGDRETVKHVSRWGELSPSKNLRSSLDRVRRLLESVDRKLPRDIPAERPEEIDLLWADFFVTGDYEPIARILDVLDQKADKPTFLQQITAWSLWSNLEQHPRLGALLLAREADRPATTRRLIQEWRESKHNKSKRN